jgi:type III pantothenate kinase
MILTIDIGNTTIQGCLFEENKNILTFRKSTNPNFSSDEIGMFLRNVILLNGFDYKKIKFISCCSVVPSLNHSIANAFKKYFNIDGLFVQSGIKTGLKLKYSNPKEIGADRISASIGASVLFPNKNLIVVDMGTATTIDVITKQGEYLGGAILPGIKMSVTSLATGTAKLPTVEILKPSKVCGSSTIEAIQSGIYFSQVGAIKQFIENFQKQIFDGEKPIVVATGGFSKLFESENIFEAIVSDLVHIGLLKILELNKNEN